jgi:hypothetical protein
LSFRKQSGKYHAQNPQKVFDARCGDGRDNFGAGDGNGQWGAKMRELLTATIIFSGALAVSLPAFAKTSDTKTVKQLNNTKAPVPPSGSVPLPYPNNATSNASKKSPSHIIKYRPRPGYPAFAK